MTTTKNHPVLNTTDDHFRRVDGEMRRMMVGQIARMTLFAISGGRVEAIEHGIRLPNAHGYSVTVELDANDTYVVRRLFTRKPKGELVPVTYLHGEAREVYCERLSEVCYYASCYVSYDAQEWPTKA
jgi:hypothetical protein